MILRLAVLLCASGAAVALQLPTPLRASPYRHPRARQLVATEFGFLETVKEKLTQLTDLRICRASHILVKGNDTATLERIAEWKREIGNDEELFAKFAAEHSTCPSRTRGGDLGYFPRGKMVMEFDRVVFNEEPGAVYGPVRTDFGNHLIFLHSCRRESDIPPKRPGR
jgi:parvulin-like peptidyl-prolyl isomerase